MDSNLPGYKTLLIDELTYRFTTDSNDIYECAFVSFANYFSAYPNIAANFYSFNLVLVSDSIKHKGTDQRIAHTVIRIVSSFLSSMVNAVVYVCDPTDGRDAARFKKFRNWYSYTSPPFGKIIQVTREVDGGGMTLRTALLIHEDNPRKDEFVQAYFQVLDKE
ncbi:MAG TPA: DUF6169 family protein [Flavisolibacter sp.]|nr:DUF6169 family protein [Flavisolibacter sp.]